MVERLRVLVLGGYGTFGSRLVRLLADDARLHLIVAGRSLSSARVSRRRTSKTCSPTGMRP